MDCDRRCLFGRWQFQSQTFQLLQEWKGAVSSYGDNLGLRVTLFVYLIPTIPNMQVPWKHRRRQRGPMHR